MKAGKFSLEESGLQKIKIYQPQKILLPFLGLAFLKNFKHQKTYYLRAKFQYIHNQY